MIPYTRATLHSERIRLAGGDFPHSVKSTNGILYSSLTKNVVCSAKRRTNNDVADVLLVVTRKEAVRSSRTRRVPIFLNISGPT